MANGLGKAAVLMAIAGGAVLLQKEAEAGLQEVYAPAPSGGGGGLTFDFSKIGSIFDDLENVFGGSTGGGSFDLGSVFGGGGADTGGTSTPDPFLGGSIGGGAQGLLDVIGQIEGRGDYNIVWAGIRAGDRPPMPLTTMTVRQVLAWQDSIDHKYNSEAAGVYQILEDTLRGLNLPLDMKFDRNGQDKAGMILLNQAGYSRYKSGKIGEIAFANGLAAMWASMPMASGPKKGRSKYGGDINGNKSLISLDAVLGAIRAS